MIADKKKYRIIESAKRAAGPVGHNYEPCTECGNIIKAGDTAFYLEDENGEETYDYICENCSKLFSWS